jgi:uncharacterized protein (DUF2336 family)
MTAIVERFLRWARTAPVAQRVKAADALARAYLTSPLSPQERDDLEASLTVLLDDTAPEVREMLARALGPSGDAPHHIILALAADRPPIAAIVAELSPIILDSELVDMLAARDDAIQTAIARRPFLSRSVSAALAEIGSVEACRALVQNAGARIPRFSLDRIIERHGDNPELRLTLLERDDLPVDARQELLGRLAGSLRSFVVDRAWLTDERASVVTRDARECATIAFAFQTPAETMPALIQRLIEARELTPAFLIRAAASGQTLLFETALATLTRLPQARVRALLGSGQGGGLYALLRKAGLPEKTFPAFAATVEVLRSEALHPGATGDYRRATHIIDAIVTRYGRRPDREMDQILALLRRFAADAKRAAARGFAGQLLEAA